MEFPAYHVLAKPTGPICNLDCEYCFFLSKELLYPGDRFRMADELLETYLRQLLESQRAPEVTVAWQGGEPTLLGVALLPNGPSSTWTRSSPARPDGSSTRCRPTAPCSTTAGAEFLAEQRACWSVLSMDGPRAAPRPPTGSTSAGRGTFDRVRWPPSTSCARHEVDVNILCTVHAGQPATTPSTCTASSATSIGVSVHPVHPDRRAHDDRDCCRSLANAGVVERAGGRPSDLLRTRTPARLGSRSVPWGPRQWGRFLAGVFDEWVRQRRRPTSSSSTSMPPSPPGTDMEPARCASSRRRCGTAVALEHNGDLYSCDHFVEPDHLVGQHRRDAPRSSSIRVAPVRWPVRATPSADTLPRLLPASATCASPVNGELPQEPLHDHARRRARPQLPVRRLPALLPPHRRAR